MVSAWLLLLSFKLLKKRRRLAGIAEWEGNC
jgi:hypothetical protein